MKAAPETIALARDVLQRAAQAFAALPGRVETSHLSRAVGLARELGLAKDQIDAVLAAEGAAHDHA